MAIARFHVCSSCGGEARIKRLFDALRDFAKGAHTPCPKCGSPRHIKLKFPFGLEAGDHPCKVLDVFLPEQIVTWSQTDNSTVAFYPFLVIVESLAEGYCSAWLPYWHIVTHQDGTVLHKFGQWAPFIDTVAFAALIEQARKKGYWDSSGEH